MKRAGICSVCGGVAEPANSCMLCGAIVCEEDFERMDGLDTQRPSGRVGNGTCKKCCGFEA